MAFSPFLEAIRIVMESPPSLLHATAPRYRRPALLILLLVASWPAHAAALPSFQCDTIAVADRDGVASQIGLTKLLQALPELELELEAQRAEDSSDLRVELMFSSASGRVLALVRGWADSTPLRVESPLLHWFEDFRARRRTIQPMAEADAAVFRADLLAAIKSKKQELGAAVVIGSEPTSLAVRLSKPADVQIPRRRRMTTAVLGCLYDGQELTGSVQWPDGRTESFARRANRQPGKFMVGASANRSEVPNSTEPAVAETKSPQPEGAPRTERQSAPGEFGIWLWILASLAALGASITLWRRMAARR